jgi:HEAT repeat protein
LAGNRSRKETGVTTMARHVLSQTLQVARYCAAFVVVAAASFADEKAPAKSLAEAIARAQQSRRAILVVVSGESCPYCRALEKEMQQPGAQQELSRWIVVSLDIDHSPADVQTLAVHGIPALRVLTPAGKIFAAKDGLLTERELIAWLQANFDAAAGAVAPELTSTGELTALHAVRLARELGRRDATVREAAIRRLLGNPNVAAAPVAAAFVEGSLATRLAALEVLNAWKAPVHDLDPWRPETVTQQRLESLSAWAANPSVDLTTTSVQELSESLTQSVSESIRQMLGASSSEATAIRERLARHGKLLLLTVYELLRTAETDETRQRLTALRYRLVATDELALGWPGGIERLAAADSSTRQRAMDELTARATLSDEPLLLELFSDSEPLIRELALQALHKAGGSKANNALVRLLDDPEPNVQAAVLKQLAESPAHSALPRLKSYIAKQNDPDLLVHAVRVLRATKGKSAMECLAGMLEHESWRVRAEAAEAIGEMASAYNGVPEEDKADAYVALVELLQDEDPFVVSRAVQVLAKAHLAIAVNPLADVAERHPTLAVEVVKALSHSNSAQLKVAEHLRRFAHSADAKVRAAAVKGLCEINPEQLETELERALADSAVSVRIAAAEGLFRIMTAEFNRKQALRGMDAESEDTTPVDIASRALGALGNLFSRPNRPEEKADDKAATALDQPGDSAVAESSTETVKLPKWMYQFEEPLQKLLSGETVAERLAGALPLAATGQYTVALPIVKHAVQDDHGQYSKAAQVLRWLPWHERQQLFAFLIGAAHGPDDLATTAQELAHSPNPAARTLLWELLARPDSNGTLANSLVYTLRTLYLGDRWYDLDSVPKKQLAAAVADVRMRAAAEPRWQRLAALSLLVALDASVAADLATQMMNDPELDQKLRADAFQVMLFASEKDVAEKAAVLALRVKDESRQPAALAFLTQGRTALQFLDGGVELHEMHGAQYGIGTAEPAIPEVPPGLTAELLLPLVREGNAKQRAGAGYLLCLLGEPGGLPPLVNYWKEFGRKDAQLTKLVYRSVAALDDAAQVPLLAEIYQSMAGAERIDEQEIAAFYWTIRRLTGAEALALRKRIRDELGTETLQRNNPFGDGYSSSRL